MKLLFLIIIYFFLGVFCVFEYDLPMGYYEYFYLEKNQTYYFYFPMNEFQKAKIDITYYLEGPLDYIPVSYIYVNEYLSRNEKNINSSVIYLNSTYDHDFGEIEAESVYYFIENPGNYISVSVTPNTSIEFFIMVNIIGGYHQMAEN